MKKSNTKQIGIWLTLIILISLKPVMGQSTQMVIHKTDGTTMVFPIKDIKKLTFDTATGISELEKLSNACSLFELLKTYPNPVKTETQIEYQLEEPGLTSIRIYSQQGALIKELLNQDQPIGKHSIQWNLKDHSGAAVKPGIYLCTVKFKNQINTKRIIVIK